MSETADATVAVYVTFPDLASAEAIGGRQVEEGLAACVNIIPGMRSIYRWRGKIERDEEVVAIFKTREANVPRLAAAIEQAHPYDMPAIVAVPIIAGSGPYLDWIRSETNS